MTARFSRVSDSMSSHVFISAILNLLLLPKVANLVVGSLGSGKVISKYSCCFHPRCHTWLSSLQRVLSAT